MKYAIKVMQGKYYMTTHILQMRACGASGLNRGQQDIREKWPQQAEKGKTNGDIIKAIDIDTNQDTHQDKVGLRRKDVEGKIKSG